MVNTVLWLSYINFFHPKLIVLFQIQVHLVTSKMHGEYDIVAFIHQLLSPEVDNISIAGLSLKRHSLLSTDKKDLIFSATDIYFSLLPYLFAYNQCTFVEYHLSFLTNKSGVP